MKLKINAFEALAKKKGYKNGRKLFVVLGGGKSGYSAVKAGCCVGYEIVKEIYNLFGIKILHEVIETGEGTIRETESKFIKIGTQLF